MAEVHVRYELAHRGQVTAIELREGLAADSCAAWGLAIDWFPGASSLRRQLEYNKIVLLGSGANFTRLGI